MRLVATPRFLRSVPEARRGEVFEAMRRSGAAYGQPHLHSGVGLRRIRPFMECRCGVDLRLVFQREGDALVFHVCGDHNEVQAFLRNTT